MVLIGGIKYACERCIRGHRVTTCNHTDQPLMMIKPKGRPSSQCKHCKEMRKNKNSHSSGACTCGRKTKGASGTSINKHCGCDSGKPCACHGKRKASEAKPEAATGGHEQEQARVRQIGMDPLAAAKPASETTRTRVGEVSVPINEYIPSNMNGIGNVNDKLPDGFFQDVPLPFEPGHGLLDLFSDKSLNQNGPEQKRDGTSSLSPDSHHSSNSNNQVQSPMEGINDFFPYFPMTTSNSTSTTAASVLSSTDSVGSLMTPAVSSNNVSITPSSNNYHHYDNMIHKPLLGKRSSTPSVQHQKDTLFGTFERDLQQHHHHHHHRTNTQRAERESQQDAQSTRSTRSVEVLSLTPTFMDLPKEFKSYDQRKLSHGQNATSQQGQQGQSVSRTNSFTRSVQSVQSAATNDGFIATNINGDNGQQYQLSGVSGLQPSAGEKEKEAMDPFAFSATDAVLNLPNELGAL